jgi:G:T-mismatch repair DNA endonuclease (very short patch repair protein)
MADFWLAGMQRELHRSERTDEHFLQNGCNCVVLRAD